MLCSTDKWSESGAWLLQSGQAVVAKGWELGFLEQTGNSSTSVANRRSRFENRQDQACLLVGRIQFPMQLQKRLCHPRSRWWREGIRGWVKSVPVTPGDRAALTQSQWKLAVDAGLADYKQVRPLQRWYCSALITNLNICIPFYS